MNDRWDDEWDMVHRRDAYYKEKPMKLEIRELIDGDLEIWDAENEITVDTSLDAHWMRVLYNEGHIKFENFDVPSLIKIIKLLAEMDD